MAEVEEGTRGLRKTLFKVHKMVICSLFFVVLFLVNSGICELSRPRGVPLSRASFYQPSAEFRCLDGSRTIPYEQLNDDYCDCADASDEPGTSACPNGSFHCTNSGHKPLNIPSSRVNDGICDCCDGTDEYDTDTDCSNDCKELGRAAREEAAKQRQLVDEGHKVYLQYSQEGNTARKDKQERIEQLEREKSELQAKRDELQVVKEEAEKPEKEAKDKHEEAWKASKAAREAEDQVQQAQNAFEDLDINGDQTVSAEEMLHHPEFDIDSNGEVSLEEAREYLEDNERVDKEVFDEKVWPTIKEIYKPRVKDGEEQQDQGAPATPLPEVPTDTPPQEQLTPPPPAQEELPPVDDDDYPDEDDDEDDYHPEDYDDEDGEGKEMGDKDDNEKMPDYDEETQKLIEVADEARDNFNEADRKFKDVEREINDINSFMNLDLGANNEYFPLKDNCYEVTDSQYTYKLCPFDRASQRGKNGGAETSLGKWGKWDGTDSNKYSAMKYEKGQNCWNGPDRSVRVVISCGLQNAVLSASEPNRCEYEFKFTTPAACSSPPKPEAKEDHDEL